MKIIHESGLGVLQGKINIKKSPDFSGGGNESPPLVVHLLESIIF